MSHVDETVDWQWLIFLGRSCLGAEWLTNRDTMGCGLRKLKPASEESGPGKIYSTLKRPQVETKTGVAYTYRYLDFLIGKDGKLDFYRPFMTLCVV